LGLAERLPAPHNWQNAAAAYAAARANGVDTAAATAAICSFPGLAHRQELVDTIDGIRYINDSKATNADATEKALLCYPAIYWIAGGLPKAGGITPLAPHFGRLRHAFLIGQATEEFAATLDGSVPFTRCGEVMSMAPSPAVAERLGYAPLHFAERHLVMVPLALAIILGVSLLTPRSVRRLALIGFVLALVGVAMTFAIGAE